MQVATNGNNVTNAPEAAAKAAMPLIIPRTDLLGNNILFLADTHDRAANRIQYWTGKKGEKPHTAPIEFYKSTRPIAKAEDSTKLVQDFSKEFGTKEVIVRQRLVKESSLRADAEGGVSPGDLKNYKKRLIAAITKAIMETE